MKLRLGLLCVTAMLGACAEKEQVPTVAEISGTATYRERIMPPPDATLDVVLEDVTRADAPAEEIVRTMQRLSTAPPYSISIWFDPARILPNHRYNVRAKITAGGNLWFISDTAHPVLGPKDVRKVDIVMRAITEADTTPTPPSVQYRGMYSYMADAGWFVDCHSGIRMAVAQEGDNAALEAAYTGARSMAGAPMLTKVNGHVETRLPMEGPARPTLIVDKFIAVEAEGCSGPSSTAELENTYWKLMTLDGSNVETPEGAREIHFVLTRETLRLAGFSGCNRMTGTYRLEGEQLMFTGIAGTMMACTVSMEIERRVLDMLPRVAGWKISGETLQLTDSNGLPVATFESRYLK